MADPPAPMQCRVWESKIITLPRIQDPRGNLTFIEQSRHIPFDIQRIYYLYDVPGGESRAGHAHRTNQAFIICASGSFDVIISDGRDERRFFLNRSYYGLLVPAMLWRELENFSSGSVCIVLASQLYDEGDYIRDFEEYKKAWDGAPTK